MIAGAETDRDAELVGIFRVTISIAIGVIREAGDLADVVAEVGRRDHARRRAERIERPHRRRERRERGRVDRITWRVQDERPDL